MVIFHYRYIAHVECLVLSERSWRRDGSCEDETTKLQRRSKCMIALLCAYLVRTHWDSTLKTHDTLDDNRT